jgi:hypothetical protein
MNAILPKNRQLGSICPLLTRSKEAYELGDQMRYTCDLEAW